MKLTLLVRSISLNCQFRVLYPVSRFISSFAFYPQIPRFILNSAFHPRFRILFPHSGSAFYPYPFLASRAVKRNNCSFCDKSTIFTRSLPFNMTIYITYGGISEINPHGRKFKISQVSL